MFKNRKSNNGSRKNSDIVIAIGTSITLIVFFYVHTKMNQENFTVSELKQIDKVKDCYKPKKSNISFELLKDILELQPKTEKNIFFIDSACAKNGTVTLTPRY